MTEAIPIIIYILAALSAYLAGYIRGKHQAWKDQELALMAIIKKEEENYERNRN